MGDGEGEIVWCLVVGGGSDDSREDIKMRGNP